MVGDVERRDFDFTKLIVIPIVLATVVGAGSSFVATKVTMAVLETKFVYVDKDLTALNKMVHLISTNQAELARRGEWMTNMKNRVIRLENIHRGIK